jgi:hypothetical protein
MGARNEWSPTQWSPIDKLLYLGGIPLVTLLAVLLFVAVMRSNGHQPAAAAPQPVHLTPAASAAQTREQALSEARDAYRACLKSMGVNTSGFRGRFSRIPSRDTLRTASGVCSTVMRNQGDPAPATPKRAPSLNSL